MIERLKRDFFLQPTLTVAQKLLGKYLIHKISGKKIVGKIVETEAYIGPQDKASHAYLGRETKRNRAEYMIGGHIYIYLVYGMYWQLNLSTSKERRPECVLIRAVEPILKVKSLKLKVKGFKNLANGPGKLCRYLKLSGRQYILDVTKSKEVWLEDRGEKIRSSQIMANKRIGIDYSGKHWASKKWRFFVRNSPSVSKR